MTGMPVRISPFTRGIDDEMFAVSNLLARFLEGLAHHERFFSRRCERFHFRKV